jgi:hypothetical protein
MTNTHGSAQLSGRMSGTVTAVARHNLSAFHLWAASHFAFLAGELERQHEHSPWDPNLQPHIFEHQSYVIGSIVSSSSFLEAAINEIFTDAAENGQRLKSLDSNSKLLLSSIWITPQFQRNADLISKFQVALKLSTGNVFDKGDSPYQNIKLLVDLRNIIVHFKPEYGSSDMDKQRIKESSHNSIAQSIRGKFELNKIGGIHLGGSPFFPRKCLGFGCAEWSVRSAIIFIDDFSRRIGIDSLVDAIKDNLKVK